MEIPFKSGTIDGGRSVLLGKDAKKFIENNASKQYRISTHPDFITYDRGNLLKHTDSTVNTLAKKLSKKKMAA